MNNLMNERLLYIDPFKSGSDIDTLISELYRQSEAGELSSYEQLGDIYFNANFGRLDYNRAFFCFERASQKSKSAMRKLAICYGYGLGTETDYRRAVELLVGGASKGDIPAMFRFYEVFDKGTWATEDSEICTKNSEVIQKITGSLIVSCSELEPNADELMTLGCEYYFGRYLDKNQVQAYIYFLELSNMGSPSGNCIIADRMMDSRLGDYDPKTAINLYEEAASKNSIYALLKLAEYYKDSADISSSYYLRAAELSGESVSFFEQDDQVKFTGDFIDWVKLEYLY